MLYELFLNLIHTLTAHSNYSLCENDIEEDKSIYRWNSIIFLQNYVVKKKKKKHTHSFFYAIITFVHPFLSVCSALLSHSNIRMKGGKPKYGQLLPRQPI